MAKRRMHHGIWVLYLLPFFAVASLLAWLMRDVWHWF